MTSRNVDPKLTPSPLCQEKRVFYLYLHNYSHQIAYPILPTCMTSFMNGGLLQKADAKSTTSQILGPAFLCNKMSLSDLS